jgi:hypothetical protein
VRPILPKVPDAGRANGPETDPLPPNVATVKQRCEGAPSRSIQRTNVERKVTDRFVWTTVTARARVAGVSVDVLVIAALRICRREGQAALPSRGSGQLPATDDVAHRRLTLSRNILLRPASICHRAGDAAVDGLH